MEGIRPLFDNVIIKKDELEEKSKTGIIITGSDDNPALVATVVSVGKDVEEEIKPGDRIMYAPFSGRELGGFLILAQHDIMGVIEEEKGWPVVGSTLKVPEGKIDQDQIKIAKARSENAYHKARSEDKIYIECITEANIAWDKFWQEGK